MANILDRIFGRAEFRNSVENPKVKLSSNSILEYFGISSGNVIDSSPEKILGIPAVWAAVNFLSRTLAALPLHHYEKGDNGPKRLDSDVAALLNGAANDEMSAYALRKWFWERVLTNGRGFIAIERDAAGKATDLFGLEPSKTTIERKGGVRVYRYKSSPNAAERIYQAADVIDVAFMLKEDGVGHYGPLQICRDRLVTVLGAEKYGSKIFKNGGLPAVALEGPFATQAGASMAADEIAKASAQAFNEGKPAISLPAGHKLTALGIDPQKMQMTEFQRFLIEEIARVFQLPPIFLHELTRGTFSNAEQQDLHFVKHVVTQWARAFESEADLKLFGRKNYSKKRRQYVAHNVDGLLRGDFATRMEGLAKAVQNAILTPNEARGLENRPTLPNGDDLLMQGATVPLGSQPLAPAAPPPT
jgi:HK97 family phage portal protein